MLKKLTVATLFFMGFISYARSQSSVSGIVRDSLLRPLPSASATLYSSKDSSIAKIDITDSSGKYELPNIFPGKYFITITSVGYKKGFPVFFELRKGINYVIKDVVLFENHTELVEVLVETNKPMIEVTADKTIFNIEGSINAIGSNAFELLQKSPGVVTDRDDNILLKGKNGVRIYVDGKISPLQAKELSEYLQTINSTDIEAIELISNPSAKYEAAGNAGIINIRLKKNKNVGTNGSFSVGLAMAKTLKENSSFNINNRNKKINFFTNWSDAVGQRKQFFDLYRIQNDTAYDQHSINMVHPHTYNIKSGLDIFLDDNNTLGFMINANFNSNNLNTIGNTTIRNISSPNPSKILYASDLQPYKRSNVNYNINYRFANLKGEELILDADVGTYRSKASSYQPNYYRNAITNSLIEEKIYQNNTPTNIDIETLKLDYETPVNKGKIELGGKYSNVKTKNVFDFYNVISGVNKKDTSRSNKFNYSENVAALYINYMEPMGLKWNYRAGIRMENTSSQGYLISFYPQPSDKVKRNYTDLFPSAAISFNADKKNSFNLTYSRRIDRPNYEDLNPFENKIDELTFQKGNAFLKPQYSNIFELTHSFLSRYNTTLSYSHIRDFRANIIDTVDRNRIFRTIENLASEDIFNLNFNAPFVIKNWWNLFFTFNGYHSLYKADFGQSKKINLGVFAYSLYLQQSFNVKKGITLEITGSYNSPNVLGGTFKTDALGNLDAGIQKIIFKGRGNLKLSYADIFHTLKFRGVSDFGGAYIDVRAVNETNQIRLNFTYRFGSNLVKAATTHKPGIEEENKRINNN